MLESFPPSWKGLTGLPNAGERERRAGSLAFAGEGLRHLHRRLHHHPRLLLFLLLLPCGPLTVVLGAAALPPRYGQHAEGGLPLSPKTCRPRCTAPPRTPGSSSHSLRYFYTATSEPETGTYQFVAVGYVDEQPIRQYDSNGNKFLPEVPWVKEAEKDVSQHRNIYPKTMDEERDKLINHLATLRGRYNQTGGFHTLQKMFGCELRRDGSAGGYRQLAYDGRDYINFDKETLTWMAADVPAQVTKREWDANSARNQHWKNYLEEECPRDLQKYLQYGKETLLRRECPVGKVTRKAIDDGRETLFCQAYGFYPKETEAVWKKGEEIMEHETFRRSIAPNSDGTYHTWLSIEIDPKERRLYRCHVDHDSLPEPLVLAFKEPGDERLEGAKVNVGLVVRPFLGVLAALLLAAWFAFFFLKNW